MQFRADLHSHTTYSDGTLSPTKLIQLARQVGLSALSITDHDTLDAYPEAIAAAQEAGIILGSGVEFSCTFKEEGIHILGYDILLDHPGLNALCEEHQKSRLKRNRAILVKLAAHKFIIREEELYSQGLKSIGRLHIAKLMVEKGYVPTVRYAFQHYLGDHKSAYVRGEFFSVEEAIREIHSAQGKAFLAHPHLIVRNRIVKELLKLPFDGIECYYGTFVADQERRWLNSAAEKGLLVSGGSDYHGDTKGHISLGCSWVDEQAFGKIFSKSLT